MQPTEFVVFAVTLFLALVVLINWKRRRDQIARRLNRGLREYVSAKPPVPPAARNAKEDLIVGHGILT